MAGFEVIVRPVVFPNIRPAPARSLPPEDDPDKGLAVLSGGGGKLVALTYTHSMHFDRSFQHLQEVERTVDLERVHQKEEDGTISQTNYLDVEVVRRMVRRDPVGASHFVKYARGEPPDNVEILQKDLTRKNPDFHTFMEPDTRLPVDDRT
jgi:hypothetical protein